MNYKDIRKIFAEIEVPYIQPETKILTYSETVQSSLLGGSNRSRSDWPKAQFVVLKDFESSNLEKVLSDWKSVVGQYKNQYLILCSDKQEDCQIVDSNGIIIGNLSKLKDIVQTIQSSQGRFKVKSATSKHPLQVIYYGAPGTGKSHTIEQNASQGNSIRTTFHPDSDYSTFVGAYKPTVKKIPTYDQKTGKLLQIEEKVTYSFVPQAFLKAYVAAWKQEDPYYLIIEEINRGNCAQIFGDIFQLLDRDSATGMSKYAISPDDDIRRYLEEQFAAENISDAKIKSGEEMRLPGNLYIWATMNTSDQSLYPIDSAFKRRWNWKYIPIADAHKGYKIHIMGRDYDWWKFLETINKQIYDTTESEDKKMGYFFVKPDGSEIDAEMFVSKVLFYLWTDVLKDFGDGFVINGETKVFTEFFNFDGSINESLVRDYIVSVIGEPEPEQNIETEPAESGTEEVESIVSEPTADEANDLDYFNVIR